MFKKGVSDDEIVPHLVRRMTETLRRKRQERAELSTEKTGTNQP